MLLIFVSCLKNIQTTPFYYTPNFTFKDSLLNKESVTIEDIEFFTVGIFEHF